MIRNNTKKICCIFNLAPHYNAPIYKLMDEELKCDFYLGDRVPYPIELMNYEILKGFKKRLRFKTLFGNFYWQKGAIILSFKPYRHYIMTGEPHCISSWFILLLNRLTGRKTYLWSHGWYGNESRKKKLFKKLFFGLSHKVLLYGDYAKKLMIEEGLNADKLIPVYNSLDYTAQILIRQNLRNTAVYEDHFNNQYPVLLYIGRIQSRKKIELLIEAVNLLQKDKLFCNVMLIGKRTEETSIQELTESYGLGKYVWFYGSCYDETVLSELIYNADVCVSPGNVGLTAIHSLVYGTPVITQDNFKHQMPEFEAIKPGVTGDFFTENSVVELCKKIKYWISLDANRREIVRTNCYKIVEENYNPQKQIEVIKAALSIS